MNALATVRTAETTVQERIRKQLESRPEYRASDSQGLATALKHGKETFKSDGVSPTSRFLVTIPPPPALGFTDQMLSYRCFSAPFPGKRLMTRDDIQRYGYGLPDKMPHTAALTNVTLQFIVDDKGEVVERMHKWLDVVNNSHNDLTLQKNRKWAHFVQYKNNYATSLEVIQFNSKLEVASVAHMYEAFPIDIGTVTHAWDQVNQIMVLPVEFTFNDLRIVKKTPSLKEQIPAAEDLPFDSPFLN